MALNIVGKVITSDSTGYIADSTQIQHGSASVDATLETLDSTVMELGSTTSSLGSTVSNLKVKDASVSSDGKTLTINKTSGDITFSGGSSYKYYKEITSLGTECFVLSSPEKPSYIYIGTYSGDIPGSGEADGYGLSISKNNGVKFVIGTDTGITSEPLIYGDFTISGQNLIYRKTDKTTGSVTLPGGGTTYRYYEERQSDGAAFISCPNNFKIGTTTNIEFESGNEEEGACVFSLGTDGICYTFAVGSDTGHGTKELVKVVDNVPLVYDITPSTDGIIIHYTNGTTKNITISSQGGSIVIE